MSDNTSNSSRDPIAEMNRKIEAVLMELKKTQDDFAAYRNSHPDKDALSQLTQKIDSVYAHRIQDADQPDLGYRQNQPLSFTLRNAAIPENLKIPLFDKYNGKADPHSHLWQFDSYLQVRPEHECVIAKLFKGTLIRRYAYNGIRTPFQIFP